MRDPRLARPVERRDRHVDDDGPGHPRRQHREHLRALLHRSAGAGRVRPEFRARPGDHAADRRGAPRHDPRPRTASAGARRRGGARFTVILPGPRTRRAHVGSVACGGSACRRRRRADPRRVRRRKSSAGAWRLIERGARLIADDRLYARPCHGRLVATAPRRDRRAIELRWPRRHSTNAARAGRRRSALVADIVGERGWNACPSRTIYRLRSSVSRFRGNRCRAPEHAVQLIVAALAALPNVA